MSGSRITSAGLDPRRRRALFRSWHRGTREMDLIMGRFADARIGELSEAELADYEFLMEVQDRDLYGWLTGELQTPAVYNTPVFRKLRAFHAHQGPLDL